MTDYKDSTFNVEQYFVTHLRKEVFELIARKRISHFVSANSSMTAMWFTKEDSGPHSFVPVFFFGYGDLRK